MAATSALTFTTFSYGIPSGQISDHNGYSASWNAKVCQKKIITEWEAFFVNPFLSTRLLVRAVHHAIRPAHLLDVLQALLISDQLLMCCADIHGFFQSVRDINSSRISCNR